MWNYSFTKLYALNLEKRELGRCYRQTINLKCRPIYVHRFIASKLYKVADEYSRHELTCLKGRLIDFTGKIRSCRAERSVGPFWLLHNDRLFWNSFAKLRKEIIRFVISVCPSFYPSAWNISAPTGRIFIKFSALHSTHWSRLTKCVRQQKCERRAGAWADQSSTWDHVT